MSAVGVAHYKEEEKETTTSDTIYKLQAVDGGLHNPARCPLTLMTNNKTQLIQFLTWIIHSRTMHTTTVYSNCTIYIWLIRSDWLTDCQSRGGCLCYILYCVLHTPRLVQRVGYIFVHDLVSSLHTIRYTWYNDIVFQWSVVGVSRLSLIHI